MAGDVLSGLFAGVERIGLAPASDLTLGSVLTLGLVLALASLLALRAGRGGATFVGVTDLIGASITGAPVLAAGAWDSDLVFTGADAFSVLPLFTGAATEASAAFTGAVFTAFPAPAATAALTTTPGAAGFAVEAVAWTLTASDLTASGLTLTLGVLGGAAVVALALLAATFLAALTDVLAAPLVFDVVFEEAAEAFEADFIDELVAALVLGVDPCERADVVLVAVLADFASFFEDAILIAP